MKRFLIALFVCLIPFDTGADALSELIKFKENVEAKKEDKALHPEKYIQSISESLIRADEELRSFIDPNDFEYVKEHSRGIYLDEMKSGTGIFGAYTPRYDYITLNPDFRSGDKLYLQGGIHHEVQHLKDAVAFEEYGIGKDIDQNDAGYLVYHAILEARAYSEEAVFLYKKLNEVKDEKIEHFDEIVKENEKLYKEAEEKKDYYEKLTEEIGKKRDEITEKKDSMLENLDENNLDEFDTLLEEVENLGKQYTDNFNHYVRYKKEYEKYRYRYEKYKDGYDVTDELPYYSGVAMQFSQAIETGKTEEEARHIVAIATLNSNTFIEAYMEKWGNSSLFPDIGYMSPEFIIGEVLNDGKFTLEDFYSAEKFWWKICKYKNAKGLDACATAKEHWVEKHCGRSDVIKSFCSGSGKRLRASEQCLVRNKNVISISEKEKTKNKACCSSSWDFPLNIFDD